MLAQISAHPICSLGPQQMICNVYNYLLQNMGAVHSRFILDVVSGCIEHNKLLDIVVSVFCRQDGKYFTKDRSKFVGKSVK